MSTLLRISELTGVSIEQLEYGFDYDSSDEVGERPFFYRKEIEQMIGALHNNELRLLRQLIPYLTTPQSKADA